MKTIFRSFASALVILASQAIAQSPPPPAGPQPGAVPELRGQTVDGRAFNLAALRGKVVLVLFWSTDCAVCRDKMPELRENYAGWRGKPFELVTVSVDRKMQDLQSYEAIVARMVPLQQRFVQMWAGESGHADSFGRPPMLPAAWLLDKSGKVVERYTGRIPPEAWDRIADLL